MTGFILKLISAPILVYLADLLFRQINYASWLQIVGVGIAIALIGQLMEVIILMPKTAWISTGMDFVASFALVYLSGFILPGARVTLFGALIAALLIGVVEHFLHLYLIETHKTEKSRVD